MLKSLLGHGAVLAVTHTHPPVCLKWSLGYSGCLVQGRECASSCYTALCRGWMRTKFVCSTWMQGFFPSIFQPVVGWICRHSTLWIQGQQCIGPYFQLIPPAWKVLDGTLGCWPSISSPWQITCLVLPPGLCKCLSEEEAGNSNPIGTLQKKEEPPSGQDSQLPTSSHTEQSCLTFFLITL